MFRHAHTFDTTRVPIAGGDLAHSGGTNRAWGRSLLRSVAFCVGLACRNESTSPNVEQPTWRSISSNGFVAWFFETADSVTAARALTEAVAGQAKITAWFGAQSPTAAQNEPAPTARQHRIRVLSNGVATETYLRERWAQPSFVRECWMIAFADSVEAQFLSLNAWRTDACGHDPGDRAHFDEVVLHESVHVYHRRVNTRSGFVGANMAWFVEGIAAYMSGQVHTSDIVSVRTRLLAGYRPASLSEVLTGQLQYAGAGAMVRYLDITYGRDAIVRMMRAGTIAELLQITGKSESELLQAWYAFSVQPN